MKNLKSAFMLSVCLTLCGCMTTSTMDAAKGSSVPYEGAPRVQTDAPKPGYYALLPFALAGDVVTAPLQLLAVLWGTALDSSIKRSKKGI